MASEKTVTRTVASVLLVALLSCYSMIAKEAVSDISIIGLSTPKGVALTLALLVGTIILFWAAYALIVDIITGGITKPSK